MSLQVGTNPKESSWNETYPPQMAPMKNGTAGICKYYCSHGTGIHFGKLVNYFKVVNSSEPQTSHMYYYESLWVAITS